MRTNGAVFTRPASRTPRLEPKGYRFAGVAAYPGVLATTHMEKNWEPPPYA